MEDTHVSLLLLASKFNLALTVAKWRQLPSTQPNIDLKTHLPPEAIRHIATVHGT